MKIARFSALVLLAVFLSACSNKIVKTYEGAALAKKDVAILVAGETIEVVSVNGKKVNKYLLKNLETSYGLKPGSNEVVFQYTEVWAKAPRGQEDSRSELVASGSQLVQFEAKAGETYRFEYDRVEDVRESRILAESFSASVVDNSNAVIALSSVYDAAAIAAATAAAAPVSQNAALMPSNDLPAIDAMKLIWERASSEDKKAFLQWAFQ